jgi:hypothetical protein
MLPLNIRSVSVITPPADEPVDVATAALHLRVDGNAEDALIQLYIAAARANVEEVTGLYLVQQQVRVTFDRFEPREYPLPNFDTRGYQPMRRLDPTMRLPVWPLQSVDAVQYLDVSGTQQTLATDAYVLDKSARPARLTPAPGQDWPATQCVTGAVTMDCTVGYAPSDAAPPDYGANVPAAIKAAILLLVGDMYANREAGGQLLNENPAVGRLLFPYRSMWA